MKLKIAVALGVLFALVPMAAPKGRPQALSFFASCDITDTCTVTGSGLAASTSYILTVTDSCNVQVHSTSVNADSSGMLNTILAGIAESRLQFHRLDLYLVDGWKEIGGSGYILRIRPGLSERDGAVATIVIPVSSAALPGRASAQLRKKTPARGGFYRDPIRRLASDVVGYGRIPVVIDRGGPS